MGKIGTCCLGFITGIKIHWMSGGITFPIKCERGLCPVCGSAHALWLESCQSQMVHLWRLFFSPAPPTPILLCLCWHESNIWIPADLSQVNFCARYISNIHLRVLSDNPSNDGVVLTGFFQLLNCPRAGTTCTARCLRPSAQSALLFFPHPPSTFTGSDSGYQADPSQLPEDMVHPGRDRRVPHRIHTVVCGNNELCCCCCCRLAAFAVLFTVCD